ncbi:MAG: TldD/PmbA family protein [Syntrophobacteria bacterium]
MLGRETVQDLSKEVLRRCGNDPAEVIVSLENQALTRFARNHIHQNVAEANATVVVRLLRGKRLGLATTNRTDGESLGKAVERARMNAEASPEDPDYPGLPDPARYVTVDSFDPFTADYAPEARAEGVGEICRLAAERRLSASGAFSTGTSEIGVANSLGLYGYHCSTHADLQTVVTTENSSGRVQASAWRVGDIPVESLAREAIAKAEKGRNPRRIDPGEYAVVLSPQGTEDLLMMLNLHGMGAQSVLEGRSWMNDRLGKKVMSDLVDIWDDGLDPAGMPLPFDFEGVPKQRVDIVHRGVVKSPVHDRITARKMGRWSTGHARPPALRTLGPTATSLFMAPGTVDTEEMIRATRRGLYITRFWYTRLVHPRDCTTTGMTRNGVFVIENGEPAYPVNNLRFTQSYVEALANVELVGRKTCLLASEFGGHATRVPAVKIGRFTFTGSTV